MVENIKIKNNDLDNKENVLTNSAANRITKKILFVSSEAQPFCATGGLADVCGSLPKEIKKLRKSFDIRVVLPLYSNISNYYRQNFKFIGSMYVTLSWRKEYCGVFEYELDGVKFYFIDNEQYFKRDGGVYGYYDDGERFAFFSKSILEILPLIDFFPDIIHANDWETALVPVYLKTAFWDEKYHKIRTILTIHNIQYQGRFDRNILVDVLGIDEKFSGLLTFDNDVNIIKAGIICADKLTTVSESYAEEIKEPEFGGGLHNIVRENDYKLTGILNGIDYDFYNPETDEVIYSNYSKSNLDGKKFDKEMLQKEFGLEVNSDIPIIAFCSRMNFLKGFQIIKTCIEKIIRENNVEFVGVGSGEREYEDFFRYLNNKYSKKVHISIGYSLEIGRKIYSGSDIYIMPSINEPCGLSQLIASRYGVVPLVRETGGLKDTIKDFGCEGGGNGYTFASDYVGDFEFSLCRAISDYSNKQKWNSKVKKVMGIDFSWKKTAKKYIEIYNSI